MDTRELAKQKYVEMAIFSGGHVMSLEAFAARSGEILGEQVAVGTIRTWSALDKWGESITDASFEGSEELRETRDVLRMWFSGIKSYKGVEIEDKTSAADLSSMAGAYRKIVNGLPRSLVYLIEDEIVEAREILLAFTLQYPTGGGIPTRYYATASGVWHDLGKAIFREIPETDGEVDADQLIMSPGR